MDRDRSMFSTAIEPVLSRPNSCSALMSSSPASRATSHITTSPAGLRAAPVRTTRCVVPTVVSISRTTSSVRSAGVIRRRCSMTHFYQAALQLPQAEPPHLVVRALADDQGGSSPRRGDVLHQVGLVDRAPEGAGVVDGLVLGDLGVLAEVRVRVLERGRAQLAEPVQIPALDV